MGKLKDFLDDIFIAKRYAKSHSVLLFQLSSFITIWCICFGNPLHYDHISIEPLAFVTIIIAIFGTWYINRIFEKLAIGKEVKMGIAFYTDDRKSIDRIITIIEPIILQLKRDKSLKFISFIQFNPNEITSSDHACDYLNKNHFGIENLLWLKIEIDFIGQSEKLIISEGLICLKNVHKQITFNEVAINLSKELDFISATSDLSYIEVNQFFQKEQLKQTLRQIILYSLGVSCILRMKFTEALNLLKAIYNPEVPISDLKQEIDVINSLTVKSENLLSDRLSSLLSCVYTQVSYEFQRRGEYEVAYNVCKEAECQLGRIPQAYWIFVLLARLSYEMNRIEDAKIYTEKMLSSVGKVTDEVILNKAFFSIIEDQIDNAVFFYKQLSPERITCNPVEVVSFLHIYEPKLVTQLKARDYAVGVLTTYYLDELEGKQLLSTLLNSLPKDVSFTKMRNHIKQILIRKYRSKVNRA